MKTPHKLDRTRQAAPQVFEWLRGSILSLQLAPGTALSRTELAERFELSQTPVRDALLQLAQEGLVDIFPQHATLVSRIDIASATQAHFLRCAIELEVVRTLALAACMSGMFKDTPGIQADALWKESMATAGYAQWLARTLGSDVKQSWLAGFLVRVGELIIAQKAPEQMAAIEQLPHQAGGRWQREKRLLGFSGAQLTAALARRWRFPDSIVRALETAEDPVAAVPFCRLGGIVHVAMLLAEIGLEEPKSPADTIASLPEEIKRALQLDSAWLAEHLPPVADFVDVSVR